MATDKNTGCGGEGSRKVYEMVFGSKLMYGAGICWLEGWKEINDIEGRFVKGCLSR